MSELPEGWVETTLGTIAGWGSGGTPSRGEASYYGGNIPWIKTGELGPRLLTSAEESITEQGLANSSAKLFPAGSVAIAMYGATIGKTSILGIPATTNQACAVGIPRCEVTTKEYLYHFLCSQKEAFVEAGKGGAQPNISQAVIKDWSIPLAPLAEQKRIADKLDSVLARVDACRDRLDRLPALLKRFRLSILAAATSGRLTEDWRNRANAIGEKKLPATRSPIVIFPADQDGLVRNWKWQQLTALARLESGHTPRKSVSEYWENGTVPWISLQDIREADGTVIQDTKFKPTELGIANSSARLLPAGTVCFCRDISFGYVTIMGKEMSTTQHFANWVCGDDLVPKYLMYAFMAARDFLGMSGQGTTVTTIYMPALKELRLATPPIEEQHEIVRRVTTLFAFADRLEARLGSARAQVDKLTPALLAKAFRGELVPQDPADEPASELLKRLAAARAEAPKPKRGRKSAD